jgi:putative endonuclease
MARHLDLGARGEDVAARRYERAGFDVVERNWRCKEGELDLVLRRGALVVFCEVKTRSTDRFGSGAASVDARRQRRLRNAALMWLRSCPDAGRLDLRFDVALVRPRGDAFAIDVIESAF